MASNLSSSIRIIRLAASGEPQALGNGDSTASGVLRGRSGKRKQVGRHAKPAGLVLHVMAVEDQPVARRRGFRHEVENSTTTDRRVLERPGLERAEIDGPA